MQKRNHAQKHDSNNGRLDLELQVLKDAQKVLQKKYSNATSINNNVKLNERNLNKNAFMQIKHEMQCFIYVSFNVHAQCQ